MDGGSLMRRTGGKGKGGRAVECDGRLVFGSGTMERAVLGIL